MAKLVSTFNRFVSIFFLNYITFVLNKTCFLYFTQFFRAKPLPSLNQKPHPNSVTHDYIGPPDANSNLRPIVRHSISGFERTETESAYLLRTRRLEVENWNQAFWSNHNKRFIEVT